MKSFFGGSTCIHECILYFNLPGTVWDSVRAPQAVFGDGKSPFEVLLVRARADLMSGDSSKRAAAGQYFLQGY